VSSDHSSNDSLLRLAHNLRELELVIGPRARPVVIELQASLREAMAKRDRADLPGALETIRQAMERLAMLAGEVDAAQAAEMRLIAHQFVRALSFGDRSGLKTAVNLMRHRAGDSSNQDNDW
jgi:hypothetical protein